MIEIGSINSNYLNSRGLHFNGEVVWQLAENVIKGTRKLWYGKEQLCLKKFSLESCHHNSRISLSNFSHKNFYQPNLNKMDPFNTNFKKQRKRVSNKITDQAKNWNQNLDIEGVRDLRKLHTNNIILTHFQPMFDWCRNQVVGFY